MAENIKTFKESVPTMRFIGKKYPDFGGWWGDWFANGWFDEIEKAMGGADTILKIWENGAGYVGLERRCDKQPFEYWIGWSNVNKVDRKKLRTKLQTLQQQWAEAHYYESVDA